MSHSYKMTFSKFFTRKNKDEVDVPKEDEPLMEQSPSGSPTVDGDGSRKEPESLKKEEGSPTEEEVRYII